MFMLIWIDDDFSHLYIPTEQIKTVSIFFLPNYEKEMATTVKQKSALRFIITT